MTGQAEERLPETDEEWREFFVKLFDGLDEFEANMSDEERALIEAALGEED